MFFCLCFLLCCFILCLLGFFLFLRDTVSVDKTKEQSKDDIYPKQEKDNLDITNENINSHHDSSTTKFAKSLLKNNSNVQLDMSHDSITIKDAKINIKIEKGMGNTEVTTMNKNTMIKFWQNMMNQAADKEMDKYMPN